jgi:hypothetical protein
MPASNKELRSAQLFDSGNMGQFLKKKTTGIKEGRV